MKQAILLAITYMASMATLADAQRGQKLHDAHCMKCHDDSVYTRDQHFVTSKEALVKQVKRCALNTNTQWSEKDVNDVVDYLNATYYKFD
ncbi:MAG: cytochrome c [Gammaproteobacteria bacterium]|jgi:mono/diheme cytochrome c family protein